MDVDKVLVALVLFIGAGCAVVAVSAVIIGIIFGWIKAVNDWLCNLFGLGDGQKDLH